MEKKNNGVIIILMGIIIVILMVLCILFATDTIKFNFKVDNNNSNKGNLTEKNDLTDNSDIAKETSTVGNYQGIFEYSQGVYTIYEFELSSDNKVKYVIGSSHNLNHSDASIVMNYTGTYLEKENEVILSIISTDECDSDGKYPCKDIITLVKNSDGSFIDKNDNSQKFNKINTNLLLRS